MNQDYLSHVHKERLPVVEPVLKQISWVGKFDAAHLQSYFKAVCVQVVPVLHSPWEDDKVETLWWDWLTGLVIVILMSLSSPPLPTITIKIIITNSAHLPMGTNWLHWWCHPQSDHHRGYLETWPCEPDLKEKIIPTDMRQSWIQWNFLSKCQHSYGKREIIKPLNRNLRASWRSHRRGFCCNLVDLGEGHRTGSWPRWSLRGYLRRAQRGWNGSNPWSQGSLPLVRRSTRTSRTGLESSCSGLWRWRSPCRPSHPHLLWRWTRCLKVTSFHLV